MASLRSRSNPDDEYEANLEALLSHSCVLQFTFLFQQC